MTRRQAHLAFWIGPTALLAIASCAEEPRARRFAGPTLGDEIERIDPGNACATSSVAGLSQQLVEVQMSCVSPGAFVAFDQHPNIVIAGSNVFPYMQASARDALWAAADQGPIHVTSAFRTLAQQYVLYHSGACPTVAAPGKSNHESGLAVDLDNWSEARGAMIGAGCAHPNYSGDPFHFDCDGTPLPSDSVRAFQTLWNINNPDDQITVDGNYGAATEERLERSPAQGFPTVGECVSGGGGGGGGTEAPKRAADVYAINRHGGTDTTEVHVLSAASRFESFRLQTATALGPTDAAMHELGVGDFDGDGRGDIYMIGRNGESGTTEVHVLDARDDFASFLLQTATALHPTADPLYDFGIGDFDGDGRDDVYAIIREGQSGTTEVHVLDAARDFGDYLVHSATALHPTAEGPYDFGVGDFDGDGRDDVYLIIRSGQSGTTEVHVLDASRNFEAFLTHAVSGLHPTDSSAYDFGVGDFDIDGKDDVYAIIRTGSSERTEVHVLSASSDFAEFLVHAASALHPTVDSNFTFAVGAL